MKRLEEMHLLAEALDKRMLPHTLDSIMLAHTFRWHGEGGLHTTGQSSDRKGVGS